MLFLFYLQLIRYITNTGSEKMYFWGEDKKKRGIPWCTADYWMYPLFSPDHEVMADNNSTSLTKDWWRLKVDNIIVHHVCCMCVCACVCFSVHGAMSVSDLCFFISHSYMLYFYRSPVRWFLKRIIKHLLKNMSVIVWILHHLRLF